MKTLHVRKARASRNATYCALLALLIGCGAAVEGGLSDNVDTAASPLSGADPIPGSWATPAPTPVATTQVAASTPDPEVAAIPPGVGATYQGVAADGTFHAWLFDRVHVSTAVSALYGQEDFHGSNGAGSGVHLALVETGTASDPAVAPASVSITAPDGSVTAYAKSPDKTPQGNPIYYPAATKSGTWLEVVSSCQMFLRSPTSRTEFFRAATDVPNYPDNTWLPKQTIQIRENDGNFDAMSATLARVFTYHYDPFIRLTSVTEQLGIAGAAHARTILKITWDGHNLVTRIETGDGNYLNFAYKFVNRVPILAALTKPSQAPIGGSGSAYESILLSYSDLGHFNGYETTKTEVADGTAVDAHDGLADANEDDGLSLTLASGIDPARRRGVSTAPSSRRSSSATA